MPATSPPPLQELRDVHLPDPVSLWPPAPGWWIVGGLVVLGIMAALWFRTYRRRTRARRLAMAELASVKQQYLTHHNDQWAVQRLSEIIRRYALAAFPRTEVAGLAGTSWLRFLDQTGRTTQFTEGVGRLLHSEPYRPQTTVPAGDLMPLVEQWIRHVTPSTRRHSG